LRPERNDQQRVRVEPIKHVADEIYDLRRRIGDVSGKEPCSDTIASTDVRHYRVTALPCEI